MKAYVDRVDDLELIERLGVVRSLTRKARIQFEDADTRASDFSALAQALSICPAYRTSLQAVDNGPAFLAPQYQGFNTLFLVERSPKVVLDEPDVVDVLLKYEHIIDGPNQELLRIPTRNQGFVFGKFKTSIVDKTTNFYYRNGDTTQPRTLIQVAHTFPDWDNRASAMFTDPNLPKTVIQTGEINIPFPQSTYHLEGFVTTGDPVATANQFIPCINDDTWLGRPAFTWLCSSVEYELLDKIQNLYKFAFEFQYNVDTWQPVVAFHDQATGRPPANLIGSDNPPGGGRVPVANPNSTDPVTLSWIENNYHALGDPTGLQPLGYWQVPALKPVNFPLLFQTFQFG